MTRPELVVAIRRLRARCTSEIVQIDRSDQAIWRTKERHAWEEIERELKALDAMGDAEVLKSTGKT